MQIGSNNPFNDNDVELIAWVAERYYLDQLTQSEIAEKLGVSRSTVSRLLSRARELGIVKIQITRPQLRRFALEQSLQSTFGLTEAIVIGMTQNMLSASELRYWVGRRSAPFVDQLIKPGMLIGVGRGRTLAELAQGLSELANPRNIKLVQVLGEVDIHASPTRATEITRLLSESYGGEAYYLNTPALVADVHLAQVLMQSPSFQKIRSLYDELDMAIVGVGALADSPLVMGGLIGEDEIRTLAQAGVVGDICGHFYNSCGEVVDHAYSGCAIGISWEQLLNCPRVVVIAAGEEKVKPLLPLLKIKMVDVLVTDERTAASLLNGVERN